MPTEISLRTHRWLQGNPTFMDWLTAHGVDPHDTREIAINDGFTSMTVVLYKRDASGGRFLEADRRTPAMKTEEVTIRVPFPMRLLDPKTAR